MRSIKLLSLIFVFTLAGCIINLHTVRAQDTPVKRLRIDEKALEGETIPKGDPVDRLLCGVDTQVITMADYRARYGDTVLTYGRLEPMINQLLLLAEARNREISISQDRLDRLVEKQMDRLQKRSGGIDSILRQRGLTEKQFRSQLRRRIKTKFLESRVLGEVFPAIRSQDTRPASVSVRARMILVDKLTEAWRLYRWMKSQPTKKTWNRLFENHSKKISLMGDHGDLGWFGWGQFNRKIEYRVFKLPLYTVSEPFRLQEGYALVYPTGFRRKSTLSEPSETFKAYRRYRSRFLREKLYDRLRREKSVIIPTSVKDRLYG